MEWTVHVMKESRATGSTAEHVAVHGRCSRREQKEGHLCGNVLYLMRAVRMVRRESLREVSNGARRERFEGDFVKHLLTC